MSEISEVMAEDQNRRGRRKRKRRSGDEHRDYIAQRDSAREFACRLGYSAADGEFAMRDDSDDE